MVPCLLKKSYILKYQNHFYSFNKKRNSIRKKNLFFSTYYCPRNHPFFNYTTFLNVLSIFFSLFSSLLFLCLRHRSDLSLFSGSLLYGMCETRGAFPLQYQSNERWKREVSAVTPERSRKRERERELVRRKDNRTIKSQIRGQLVLGRVLRGCRRNNRETYAEKSMLELSNLCVMKHRDTEYLKYTRCRVSILANRPIVFVMRNIVNV